MVSIKGEVTFCSVSYFPVYLYRYPATVLHGYQLEYSPLLFCRHISMQFHLKYLCSVPSYTKDSSVMQLQMRLLAKWVPYY